LVCTGRP